MLRDARDFWLYAPGEKEKLGTERYVKTTSQPTLFLPPSLPALPPSPHIPPSLHLPPCSHHVLAKTMAAVTPMKPKKGAEAGHFSI